MSSIERTIVSLGIFAMFSYLVIYQFFFIPAFNGNEPYVSEGTIDLLGWATAGLVLVCVVLLLRDLKHRDISGKAGWVVGILFFTWVGLPYYFFKHARRPLTNAT
jgi:hypothetical protein